MIASATSHWSEFHCPHSSYTLAIASSMVLSFVHDLAAIATRVVVFSLTQLFFAGCWAAGLRELLVVDTSAGSGKSIGIAAEVKVKTKTPAPTFLEDPVFPSSKSSWNPKPEKSKARCRKTSKAFLIQSS